MTRAERTEMLIELSKQLEKCSSLFLAAVLVEEAFGRDCMEEIAFGKGSLDTAVRKVVERLRRQIVPARYSAAIDAPKRGRRRPVARVGELLARAELKALGEPLPHGRRIKDAA